MQENLHQNILKIFTESDMADEKQQPQGRIHLTEDTTKVLRPTNSGSPMPPVKPPKPPENSPQKNEQQKKK